MFYGREVEMPHVNCPLCGRNQALSKFNPKALDDDISRSLFSRIRPWKGL